MANQREEKLASSISQDAQQFYKTGHEVGLNPGDKGGPQADFFERFLRTHCDNVKDETIRTVRNAYVFTKRLHDPIPGNFTKKAHNLLTCRERKELGIFNVQKGQLTYKEFLRIHDLWKGYFKEAVPTDAKAKLETLQPFLLKADYSGCFFVVAASKCPSLIGLKGLVVQETKNVFRLITKEDRFVNIPKKGTLFAFTFGDKVYKIYGSHFRKHGFERTKIKFKVFENILL